MSAKRGGLSRREFVRATTGAAAVGLLGVGQSGAAEDPKKPKSRVVLVRRPEVLDDQGRPVAAVLHEMLNEGVTRLLGQDDAAAAWKRLIKADDVVGIKSNVWRHLRTPLALEDAIRSELLRVGVDLSDVAVDDRGVLGNPVFERATAFVNVRPMRSHHWSGLGTCIKNMIMFVPKPWEYHGDTCAPLGAIWKLPQVDGKVRLNILVMLTPQFHGVGPHSFSKEFVWPYGGLILGVDPVAVDATGARIIQAQRDRYFEEPRPIRPRPHHIQVADERYGLGNADPAKIDLVVLGNRENLLI